MTYLRMLLAASLFAGLLGFQPDKANASLIGDTVGCTIPNAGFLVGCSSASATVGAGVEFLVPSVFGNAFTLDVDASSVTLTSLIGVSGFIGTFELIDLDWVDDPAGFITGVTNFSTTANSGIDVGDILTGPNSVFIDIRSSSWSPGDNLQFDLVATHSAVPLPAALPLFGTGLAVMGFIGWRRKRKAAA